MEKKCSEVVARQILTVRFLPLRRRDDRVVRSLDTCIKGPGFKTTFRPIKKCQERISQLSVIPGKRTKGIMSCGHIERKDQGRTARLVYLFSGPFVLST